MDPQDRLATRAVRIAHGDLAVEAARPQQRLVEHIGPVGRGDHDHAGRGVEAVHLGQQLVERLLPLVVAAAEPGAALPSDRVDLVDEDDRGCGLLGLAEQVAHTRRAHADEQLHELRRGDAEERNVRLAGHGARQQRLAGARRADQQHAARQPRAQLLIARRDLEEVHDLGELDLGLVLAGHVIEGDARPFLVVEPRLRLADPEEPLLAPLR